MLFQFTIFKHYIIFNKMKNILSLAVALLLSFTAAVAQDKKDTKTTTIKVDGVCASCKKRIENAAYINGVKHAEWDKETGLLTVSYKPSKVSRADISKAVADKGHNAGDVKADTTAYKKLPKCCAYNDGVHKH